MGKIAWCMTWLSGAFCKKPRSTIQIRAIPLTRAALFPRMDECFGLDAERIGDAIDVVEVTNHLRRIMDNLVISTSGTEHIEVGRTHDLRRLGQLLGVFEECPVQLADACLAPVRADMMDEQIGLVIVDYPKIFDLSTEVVRMRAPSVEAVVDGGCDRRQHFALAA